MMNSTELLKKKKKKLNFVEKKIKKN